MDLSVMVRKACAIFNWATMTRKGVNPLHQAEQLRGYYKARLEDAEKYIKEYTKEEGAA